MDAVCRNIMNNFSESIVEDAALDWLKELGYEIGYGPEIAPGEPATQRDALNETVLPNAYGRLCANLIRRFQPMHSPKHSVKSRSRTAPR